INSSSGESSGSSTSWIRTKDYSPIEQGRMVTISSPEFYNIYFFEYDINHNFLELVQTGYTNERTFKLNSNTAYFKVSSRNRDSSNMETSILGKELKVQVEYGTKATTWKDALVDNEARMVAVETSIKQLPDEIDLSVKEGLRGVGNLVKNPELTESTEGWNSGNGLRYMKVTYGEFDGTGALRSEAETNTQTYSEWFDVDPSKAYEVSMWVRKSANRGRWYLGVHGSDNPTGSANNLGFTTVNKFSGSPIT